MRSATVPEMDTDAHREKARINLLESAVFRRSSQLKTSLYVLMALAVLHGSDSKNETLFNILTLQIYCLF